MRVSDNYNHLLEAPTVFYAITTSIILLGAATTADQMLAWAFVGLRCVHSVVQATFNLEAVVNVRSSSLRRPWIRPHSGLQL